MLENTLLVILSWENVETLLWCVLSLFWLPFDKLDFVAAVAYCTQYTFFNLVNFLFEVNHTLFGHYFYVWTLCLVNNNHISFPRKVSNKWPRIVWDSTLLTPFTADENSKQFWESVNTCFLRLSHIRTCFCFQNYKSVNFRSNCTDVYSVYGFRVSFQWV